MMGGDEVGSRLKATGARAQEICESEGEVVTK